VDNVVQANLLAATAPLPASSGRIYNVGCGANTTLNELFDVLRRAVARHVPAAAAARPVYGPFRPGDVRRSQAALSLIRMHLGYRPAVSVSEGLANTVDWYFQQQASGPPALAR
jgi:UDP-N-acetylglucosamine 4-epimerase